MSKQNYDKAKELIESNKGVCFFAGVREESLIEKAEKALGISFSPQYRDFVKNYGAGSIGSEEIYGVINDNFDDASVPNGVWFTLVERMEIEMPENLVVLLDTGGDEFFCFDYANLDEHGEPPVVVFVPGVDKDAQTYEVIAKDFGDYLLKVTEQEI